jgi:hypothetical protein
MQVCHSQPHLVPPMKLVFYDNLPSPGPASRSSFLPPWVSETKSLASRASSRASLLVRRKTTARKRPTISGPTDFRRVDSRRTRRRSFRPLELSIYLPGNRLSDLPEFLCFDVETPGQPSPPPRALVSPFESARPSIRRPQSAPFQLARKPVGSGSSRRSSLATFEQQQDVLAERQTLSLLILNPLVPHFSTLSPVEATPTDGFMHLRRRTEPLDRVPESPVTPTQSKPLPTIPDSFHRKETLSSSPPRHSLHYRISNASTGKRRAGQSSSSMSASTDTSPQKQSYNSSGSTHTRSRTMSSSVSSTLSTKAPSLSSTTTAATTIHAVPYSSLNANTSKDLDMLPRPISSDAMKSPTALVQPHIFEIDTEHHHRSGRYEIDGRFPGGTVGLAF